MITFISSTEAHIFYAGDSGYEPDQKTQALTGSYSLVLSHVSNTLRLPVIPEWDGTGNVISPYILKLLQARFYQYLLESSNGYSDETQKLYDSTVKMCEKVQQGNITLPSQVLAHEVGWQVVQSTDTTIGAMYVRGVPPLEITHYRIVLRTGGVTLYVASGNLKFDVYRADSDAKRQESVAASYEWTQVDNSELEVRFDGQFADGHEYHILGIPQEAIDTAREPGRVIRQGPIAYGPGVIGRPGVRIGRRIKNTGEV